MNTLVNLAAIVAIAGPFLYIAYENYRYVRYESHLDESIRNTYKEA